MKSCTLIINNMNKAIYLAIHTAIINKPEKSDKKAFYMLSNGWKSEEATIDNLAKHINNGYPFTVQHRGNRKEENFIRSNILTVDIDHGMTLEMALADPYIKDHAALIYTTPSHTSEANRFRIVFVLDRMITMASEMRLAYTGIIRKFGGDKACKDACRLFYGSKDSNPIIIGKSLPNQELDNIIALGSEVRVRSFTEAENGKAKSGVVMTNRSEVSLEPNQMVRIADQEQQVLLTSLESKTPIHCPVHVDRDASAMVLVNRYGVHGVYCSTCAASFWPRKSKLYDFNFVPRTVQELAQEEFPYNHDDLTTLDDHEELIQPTIEEVAEWNAALANRRFLTSYGRYMPEHAFKKGVTFMRGQKGSGKTEALGRAVQQWKSEDKSILLIGHRQSLLQSMANRLGLDCYFYLEGQKTHNKTPSEHYAISLDSMSKLLRPQLHRFDAVIIDEAEQVFAHCLSSTLASKRRITMQLMRHYLRAAETIVLADADLGAITVGTVTQCIDDEVDWQFLLNDYKAKGKSLDMYASDRHLLAELVETVGKGGRHYVTTNSRKNANQIKELIAEKYPDKKLILVTSDQANDPVVQHFISNIKTEILNYDLVIASPSLGTGIDITFEDNAELIDTVFGFFFSNITTHFDIDQQLCRVRHPKEIKVWVSPERFAFETDPVVLEAELIACQNLNDLIIGFTRKGQPELDPFYLSLFSQVTALQRASKNNLKGNFKKLREDAGWLVKEVANNTDMFQKGKALLSRARAKVEEESAVALSQAQPISQGNYERLAQLQKVMPIPSDEVLSMRRFEIESFYRQPISEALVALDGQHGFRDAVRMAEVFFADPHQLRRMCKTELMSGVGNEGLLPDESNLALKQQLLRELISATGLANTDGMIMRDALIQQEGLGGFVTSMLVNKVKLQNLFNLPLRGDLKSRSVTSVQVVLKLIGLNLVEVQTKKIGKKKYRFYGIEPESLSRMQALIEVRDRFKAEDPKPLVFVKRKQPEVIAKLLEY